MWAFGETRPYSRLENGAISQFQRTKTLVQSAFSPLPFGNASRTEDLDLLAREFKPWRAIGEAVTLTPQKIWG